MAEFQPKTPRQIPESEQTATPDKKRGFRFVRRSTRPEPTFEMESSSVDRLNPSLGDATHEARERLKGLTQASPSTQSATDTEVTYPESSGGRRVSWRAAGIGALAVTTVVGLASFLGLRNFGSSDSKDAVSADNGGAPTVKVPDNNSASGITTPNGKQIVIGGTSTSTPTKEPTATPTPEKPKTVAWTAAQIAAAQKEAAANNRVVYINTWIADGGVAEDVTNVAGKQLIALDYDSKPEGKSITSPITGTVRNVGVTESAGNVRTRTLFVMVDGKEIEFIVDFDSSILVKRDDVITAGTTPIITLSGNRIPDGKFSKPAYVIVGDTANVASTTNDILHDQSGATVTLAK